MEEPAEPVVAQGVVDPSGQSRGQVLGVEEVVVGVLAGLY